MYSRLELCHSLMTEHGSLQVIPSRNYRSVRAKLTSCCFDRSAFRTKHSFQTKRRTREILNSGCTFMYHFVFICHFCYLHYECEVQSHELMSKTLDGLFCQK